MDTQAMDSQSAQATELTLDELDDVSGGVVIVQDPVGGTLTRSIPMMTVPLPAISARQY